VSPQAVANVHNHLANFKIDLDICGTANRVENLEVKMPSKPSNDVVVPPVRYFERVDKENEIAAAYKIQSKQHKYHLFSSANCTNRYGHRRSYRLIPTTTSKLLLHDSDVLSKAFSWAKYQVKLFEAQKIIFAKECWG
jgi:Cu2+-containing amine oxidase